MAHTPNHRTKTRPIRPTQVPIMAFQSVAGPSEYRAPRTFTAIFRAFTMTRYPFYSRVVMVTCIKADCIPVREPFHIFDM